MPKEAKREEVGSVKPHFGGKLLHKIKNGLIIKWKNAVFAVLYIEGFSITC
jgi:hypothetical protein